MIPVDRVFTRARQWFSCGIDNPPRRLGTWICAAALGESGFPIPEFALPAISPSTVPVIDQPLDLVRSDPALLLSLADQITDRTVFGRMTDRIPPNLLAHWASALPAAVSVAVRAHDLAVTSALLRAGAYLRCCVHPELRDAMAFVAAQQQPDGGFGALPADADPTLQDTVRVPLTLGCVWALAETIWSREAVRQREETDCHGSGLGRGAGGWTNPVW